jgi:1,4-alpha-glucan branching enzyme
LKKQYLKTRPACKVTFRISKLAAQSASEIALVGDFNAWDVQATPMTSLKNGEFTVVVELDTGTPEYQFRYLYDGKRWENDWEADGYASNGVEVEGENSIVRV